MTELWIGAELPGDLKEERKHNRKMRTETGVTPIVCSKTVLISGGIPETTEISILILIIILILRVSM